jgi:lipopolysaccharide transport system ATP-binding protein
MTDLAIHLENVSKRFILQPHRPFLMTEITKRFLNRKARKTENEFWALSDINFSVPKGQSMGLIGGNGAGKSTLLSLIIGSSRPTSGSIEVRGRIGALLELGAGFHPDLTGRENIILNASLLGLSRAEIRKKMDEIIEFTELGKFIDIPIRNYSSGMHVRLGFSVAVHIEPEILIVDEALSVGDASFQEKCMERIRTIKESGVTFLVVSHNLNTVLDLCNEIVWLDHGQVRMKGAATEVAEVYKKTQTHL